MTRGCHKPYTNWTVSPRTIGRLAFLYFKCFFKKLQVFFKALA